MLARLRIFFVRALPLYRESINKGSHGPSKSSMLQPGWERNKDAAVSSAVMKCIWNQCNKKATPPRTIRNRRPILTGGIDKNGFFW